MTAKGNLILEAMRKEYGPDRGTSVFYASRNAKTITGVDSAKLDAALAKADALDKKLSVWSAVT